MGVQLIKIHVISSDNRVAKEMSGRISIATINTFPKYSNLLITYVSISLSSCPYRIEHSANELRLLCSTCDYFPHFASQCQIALLAQYSQIHIPSHSQNFGCISKNSLICMSWARKKEEKALKRQHWHFTFISNHKSLK